MNLQPRYALIAQDALGEFVGANYETQEAAEKDAQVLIEQKLITETSWRIVPQMPYDDTEEGTVTDAALRVRSNQGGEEGTREGGGV